MSTIEIICTVAVAVVTVIGGVMGGLWFIIDRSRKAGENSHRLDNVENSVSRHEEMLNELKETIAKSMEESIKALPCSAHHDDIMKIKTVLIEKYPKSSSVFSLKFSPRRLNDWGHKLYDAIDGDRFIKENKQALFDYIKDSKPLVALDVEQAANGACLSLVPTPAFNRLKDFVYNEPTWDIPDVGKYEITVNDICFVIGLKLRDMYLDEVGIK